MRIFVLVLLISISSSLWATPIGLERINFLPETDAFARARYRFQFTEIETPKNTTEKSEVDNSSNLFSGEYAHRFGRKFFAGLRFFYEEASENAVSYGIPFPRRFSSHGIKEPELFFLYRLKEQNKSSGLIDLSLILSPKGGKREIDRDNSNRLNARNILKLSLSHGLLEEDWEFKSSLGFNYFGRGIEENAEEGQDYTLESYREFSFDFLAQYRVTEWLYANAGVGVMYRGTQDVFDENRARREIQAGTGSVFNFGLKKPLSEWSLISFDYSLLRRDYFVKGVTSNLEGNETQQMFSLSYTMAF